MTKKLLAALAFVLVAAGVYGYANYAKAPAQENMPPVPTETSATLKTALNKSVSGAGVTLTPIEVVQDSRCPKDVQCIWAGTVQVKTKIESGLGPSTMIFEIGKPITTEAEEITLTEVTPGKVAQQEIKASDYRFTFEVK